MTCMTKCWHQMKTSSNTMYSSTRWHFHFFHWLGATEGTHLKDSSGDETTTKKGDLVSIGKVLSDTW